MLDYKKLYNSDPFGTPIEKKNPWFLKNLKNLLCIIINYQKNTN